MSISSIINLMNENIHSSCELSPGLARHRFFVEKSLTWGMK